MRLRNTARILALAAFLPATTALAAPPPPYPLPPRYDHVVVVILENVNPEQVIGSPAAPYINSLANDGVSFDRLYAFKHTSAPNYGELFAGDENGITDGVVHPGAPLTTPNLGANLRNNGLSFTGYAQSLPAPGSTVNSSGDYVRGHNPWVNWQNDAPNAHPNQLPSSTNLPFDGHFPADFGQLPTVALVVPDNAHNMHDGGTPQRITVGDNWVRDNLGAFAQWAKDNNSLLIITADEDHRNLNNNLNKIPTVFYGAGVKEGVRTPQSYTLHHILRTVDDMYGLPHAAAANYVRPIVGPFVGDPDLRQVNFSNALDTLVRQDQPNTSFSAATGLKVDADGQVQSLVRFDNIVGDEAAQIPADATILSAKLTLWTAATGNTTTPVKVHRMLVPWAESSTWNTLTAGVSANDAEARAAEDFKFAPAVNAHPFFFDVSDTVQAWLDGAPNHGWAIVPTGNDAWDFVSSENATTAQRPALEVTYALYPRWAPANGDPADWHDPGNWRYGVPDAPAAVARFDSLSAAPAQLSGDVTLGVLLLNSPEPRAIQGTAGGKLIFANRGNVASVQVRQGRHAVSAPVELQDSAVIDTAARTGLDTTGGVTVLAGKSLHKSGAGELAIAGGLFLNPGARTEVESGTLAVDRIIGGGTLSVHAGAAVRLTGGPTPTSRVAALALDGALDLGRSSLIIDYGDTGVTPLPDILEQIKRSRASGWLGPGIGSSVAAADSTTAVGYLETQDDSLLIRFTLLGDATLDGVVDFADLAVVAQNYNATDGSASWTMGDFDYDHDVTFADLTLLAQNYNRALPIEMDPAFEGAVAAALAQVPEPASGVIAIVMGLAIRRRRGRAANPCDGRPL